jgi:hypothetical protein
LLATSAASLVALSALLLAPVPLAAQYWLPGPPPSGTEIIHETERIPEPQSRTYLGIRERVFLNIVSYSDIDLWVDTEEQVHEVWDDLGLVEWHNDGDGTLIPQGDSATYIAPDDAEYCPDEWVWVVVHDSGTMSWPNTAPYYVPQEYPNPFIRPFVVQDYDGSPNYYGDVVITGGPWDVDRLINPASGVHEDCEFPVVQLLQFYSSYDSWVTYASPTHARAFSADTFRSRVSWGAVWGGEQGPYEEIGQ